MRGVPPIMSPVSTTTGKRSTNRKYETSGYRRGRFHWVRVRSIVARRRIDPDYQFRQADVRWEPGEPGTGGGESALSFRAWRYLRRRAGECAAGGGEAGCDRALRGRIACGSQHPLGGAGV